MYIIPDFNKRIKLFFYIPLCFILTGVSCKKVPYMTLAEIEAKINLSSDEMIKNTVSKPYDGSEFVDGRVGGEWNTTLDSDPKTFNHLIAERDGTSNSIIEMTTDWLADYDSFSRKWKSRACSFEIEVDEEKETLTVHWTINENAVWSWFGKEETVPVTSDDIVWWYDNVAGNPDFQSSAYNSQFVIMPDGREERIKAVKIDDKHFDVTLPEVTIRVKPQARDLVQTKTIDGIKYILIRAEEGVEVNGIQLQL